MAAQTIRVRGLKELNRAFRKMETSLAKEVRDGLKYAAEPVAQEARSRKSRYSGAASGSIGPRVARGSVFVTDRAKKVTGLRGDFGSLIMREMLVPSLQQHQGEVFERVDKVLGSLAASNGFH